MPYEPFMLACNCKEKQSFLQDIQWNKGWLQQTCFSALDVFLWSMVEERAFSLLTTALDMVHCTSRVSSFFTAFAFPVQSHPNVLVH